LLEKSERKGGGETDGIGLKFVEKYSIAGGGRGDSQDWNPPQFEIDSSIFDPFR